MNDNYIDEAQKLMDMFGDDNSDAYPEEIQDLNTMEVTASQEKVAYGAPSKMSIPGGVAATAITGLLGTLLKDKLFKSKDPVTEDLLKLSPKDLENRIRGHVLDYATSSLPVEIAKSSTGVNIATNLHKALSESEQNQQMESLNALKPAMLEQLKKSNVLSNLDWNNPEVSQLLDIVFSGYPNLSKNYFILHEILNNYQNMGSAGAVNSFKQLGDVEKSLAQPKITIQDVVKAMQSMPEGSRTRSNVEKEDPLQQLKLITDSVGSLAKLSSETLTQEEQHVNLYKFAKEHFYNRLKLAYLEERIEDAIALSKQDPYFSKIANSLDNNFEKLANESLTAIREEYNAKIAASELCMLKIANPMYANKWKTIYSKRYVDMSKESKDIKKQISELGTRSIK